MFFIAQKFCLREADGKIYQLYVGTDGNIVR